jgi:hypothetical protein
MTQALVVLAVVLVTLLALARATWQRGRKWLFASAAGLVALGGTVLMLLEGGVGGWMAYAAFLTLPVACAIALLVGLCGKQRPTLLHLGLALGLAALVVPFAVGFSLTFGGGL